MESPEENIHISSPIIRIPIGLPIRESPIE
jgi:hypothetical protein